MEHLNKDVRRGRELPASARMALAVLGALTLIAIAAAARAEVKPGDMITPANASKVKDLVSPGVYYKVENGMSMKIVPSGASRLAAALQGRDREIFRAGAAQPRQSQPGRLCRRAAVPADRPQRSAGRRPRSCGTTSSGRCSPTTTICVSTIARAFTAARNKPNNVVQYYQIGHYAGYDLVGRVEVEPMPVDPDFKKTSRLWLFGLYPVLSPQAERGDGIHSISLRAARSRRRRLELERGDAPGSPSQRVDHEHRDRRADLESRSLLGLQRQD